MLSPTLQFAFRTMDGGCISLSSSLSRFNCCSYLYPAWEKSGSYLPFELFFWLHMGHRAPPPSPPQHSTIDFLTSYSSLSLFNQVNQVHYDTLYFPFNILSVLIDKKIKIIAFTYHNMNKGAIWISLFISDIDFFLIYIILHHLNFQSNFCTFGRPGVT